MGQFVSSVVRLGAAAFALCALGTAAAAPVAPAQNAVGSTTVLQPLSLTKKEDLDFGTLIVGGAGTAVVDPVTNSLATSGSIVAHGSGAHAAVFTAVTGSKNGVVIIRIPKDPIQLTRVGGSETMTVSDWTLDGPKSRKVTNGTSFDFAVGATLTVAAGQADGTYVGTFEVGVQYP